MHSQTSWEKTVVYPPLRIDVIMCSNKLVMVLRVDEISSLLRAEYTYVRNHEDQHHRRTTLRKYRVDSLRDVEPRRRIKSVTTMRRLLGADVKERHTNPQDIQTTECLSVVESSSIARARRPVRVGNFTHVVEPLDRPHWQNEVLGLPALPTNRAQATRIHPPALAVLREWSAMRYSPSTRMKLSTVLRFESNAGSQKLHPPALAVLHKWVFAIVEERLNNRALRGDCPPSYLSERGRRYTFVLHREREGVWRIEVLPALGGSAGEPFRCLTRWRDSIDVHSVLEWSAGVGRTLAAARPFLTRQGRFRGTVSAGWPRASFGQCRRGRDSTTSWMKLPSLAWDGERGWVEPCCLRSIGHKRGQVEDSIQGVWTGEGLDHLMDEPLQLLIRDGRRGGAVVWILVAYVGLGGPSASFWECGRASDSHSNTTRISPLASVGGSKDCFRSIRFMLRQKKNNPYPTSSCIIVFRLS
ncbi:hypothetical protein C8R43DRAFT_942144 [Mycena crocata]|nr:hypothetical protein C8R43DRAFT_942144 [Mycena crocata]